MKNILTVVLLMGMVATSYGQAKKYLLFEHFTNTNCSICAARNPAFFDLIGNYSDDVHHIAYHPPYPYQQCVFYQHNREENEARTEFYSIPGTPRIVWQGGRRTSPSSATAEEIELRLTESSPISIRVTETEGTTRMATITIRTEGEQLMGNYKVLAAIVERTVNYNAPNGEDVHHNVFRAMASPISGDIVTFAATGGEVTYTYEYTVSEEWEAEQAYIVAWVQDFDTGAILNSGTRFDPIVSNATTILSDAFITLTPNPTSDWLNIQLQDINSLNNTVRLFNLSGREVLRQQLNRTARLSVNDLASGMYLLQLETEIGTATKKIIVK